MNIFAAYRAIQTAEWLIAESKQPSLLSLADKWLNRELPENIRTEFSSTFSQGSRFLEGSSQRYDFEPYLLDNGVLLMPLKGLLFKEDFCYSPGTSTLANWYEQALASDKVLAIVEVVDSPGGMADGTAVLAMVKEKVNAVKPIVEYVNETMASAALWIGSASSYVFVSSPIAMIGSLGARLSYQKPSTDSNTVEIYPKTSSRKNYTSREAAKGNYKPLEATGEYLDNVFMDSMKGYRANLTQLALDGEEFFTKEAIENGLADAQGTLQDAVDMALLIKKGNEGFSSTNNQFSNNKNQTSMQFNDMQLGALMGNMGISFSAEGGAAKSPEQILSEMSAKFSAQQTQITQLTTERDTAISAKTVLEGEKTTLTAQVAELTTKVSKLPGQKPAMAVIKEGDAPIAEHEEEELPSLAFAKAQGLL